jgi:superfamily II DNA or RNA helicase
MQELLRNVSPIYLLPDDDLVNEVVIPALHFATKYDVITAFFSSNVLAEIAPGLVCYLNESTGIVRLILGPYLSEKDYTAIHDGITTPQEFMEDQFFKFIEESQISVRAIVNFTLQCLSYLIYTERIQIRFAMMKNGGILHQKVSLISSDSDLIAIHGSTNFTYKGYASNKEQARVECSWNSQREIDTITRLRDNFDSAWENNQKDLLVLQASDAFQKQVLQLYKTEIPPSVQDYFDNSAKNSIISEQFSSYKTESTNQTLIIPEFIDFKNGDYKHQEHAFKSWMVNGYKGILEMCTGSGKTITSLVGLTQLYLSEKPLFVMISVPYLPLLRQWGQIVSKFGVKPHILDGSISKSKKKKIIEQAIRNINFNISEIEIAICTIDFICDIEVNQLLSKCKFKKVLIADEVHNFGTKRFLCNLPEYYEYRLGLSATPVRQYDEGGTAILQKYFGEVVYKFGLDEGIGTCLTKYKYFVHPVTLSNRELDSWVELTEKIMKAGWKLEDKISDPYLNMLLNRRRIIIEQAENKIDVFKSVFVKENLQDLKYTLVYASDKQRSQLQEINNFLINECKLLVHQVTSEETSNGLSSLLLDAFSTGKTIQILTAMRVLDEGVDIPQITTAYILASTTVERQWIQRRGRVLRKCKANGKDIAYIHDFLVLPPNDATFEKLIKSEVKRVIEFSRLSENPYSENGGLEVINRLGLS